jgi:hypothetical protein
MLPALVAVTVTWQLPDNRLQVGEENVTRPAPDTLPQVTVPVGEYPLTVAVHVTGTPMLSDVEEHVIVTVVTAFPTWSTWVPELGPLPRSPP